MFFLLEFNQNLKLFTFVCIFFLISSAKYANQFQMEIIITQNNLWDKKILPKLFYIRTTTFINFNIWLAVHWCFPEAIQGCLCLWSVFWNEIILPAPGVNLFIFCNITTHYLRITWRYLRQVALYSDKMVSILKYSPQQIDFDKIWYSNVK